MSMWAPPAEKGKFTSALVGGAIGTVTTWPLAGWLIETVGWEFAFYVPAILAAGLTICWYLITFDSPAVHPRIAPEEREYIEKSLIGISRTKVRAISYLLSFVIYGGTLYSLRAGHPCSACWNPSHSGRCSCCTSVTSGVCISCWLERQSSWTRFSNSTWPRLVSWQVFRIWRDSLRESCSVRWVTICCDRNACRRQPFERCFACSVRVYT